MFPLEDKNFSLLFSIEQGEERMAWVCSGDEFKVKDESKHASYHNHIDSS